MSVIFVLCLSVVYLSLLFAVCVDSLIWLLVGVCICCSSALDVVVMFVIVVFSRLCVFTLLFVLLVLFA